MVNKKNSSILIGLCLFVIGALLISIITSCGKQSNASPTGLNIQYDILNLSPDLGPIDLYIDFKQVNSITNPDIFQINQGYFYVPSADIPYQFRPYVPNGTSGTTLFTRSDTLKPGLKYSLFVTGTIGDGSLKQIFTVDTASSPVVGRGKVRFVNASASATSGLDVYANGTLAFTKINYTSYTKYIELPIGNYDFQITTPGSSTVLKDQPNVTIQDGRLYTLYAYGYTNRTDSAAFNAGVIVNK